MEELRARAIANIKAAREELLAVPYDSLTGAAVGTWASQWMARFRQAESLCGLLIEVNIHEYMKGWWEETDATLVNELRVRLVGLLDNVVENLDRDEPVRPIEEEALLHIQDTKLVTLLREFNQIKDVTPNFAAIGARSILALIMQERAKIAAPGSSLATRDDLAAEPAIREALAENVFSSAEAKLLKRFLSGGSKDTADNVTHKPGAENVVERADLEDLVDLIRRLLPTITVEASVA